MWKKQKGKKIKLFALLKVKNEGKRIKKVE